MHSSHHGLVLIFLCAASAPSHAQSAFDGFRIGIEGTYSETSLRVDASKPRDAALADARARLSRGEVELANATTQLAVQRAAFDAASRALAEGQQRMTETEQRAAASPPQVAAAMAPLIEQRQRETAQDVASLRAHSMAITEGEHAAEAGRARLAEGNRQAAKINAFPGISTAALPSSSVRFSLGWGTSWETAVGRIHLGAEIDAAPGTGDAVVRVPARFDTHLEAGASFGASARLGWIPVRWAMPYVTAGVETQQFRLERGTTRSKQQSTGFRVGVGVEFSISDTNIFRVGYDHTFTPDINFAGARVTPSRDTYRAGFVRRF
jgi:opacity protein-like surface antigen